MLNEEKALAAILAYGLYEPTALDPVKLFQELDFTIDKPIIYGTAGVTSDMHSTCRQLTELGVAPFKSPERSARAMQALVEDAKNQHRKSRYQTKQPQPVRIGELPSGPLDEAQGKAILQQINIPVPKSVVCKTHDDARKAFAKLNKPVTVKVLSAEILHKTEVGGVHLNIRDDEGLMTALNSIDKIDFQGELAYLVEEMAATGLDLIVGGLRDPVFGPTLLLGMGGTFPNFFLRWRAYSFDSCQDDLSSWCPSVIDIFKYIIRSICQLFPDHLFCTFENHFPV